MNLFPVHLYKKANALVNQGLTWATVDKEEILAEVSQDNLNLNSVSLGSKFLGYYTNFIL